MESCGAIDLLVERELPIESRSDGLYFAIFLNLAISHVGEMCFTGWDLRDMFLA
jgi:hypothetical protein